MVEVRVKHEVEEGKDILKCEEHDSGKKAFGPDEVAKDDSGKEATSTNKPPLSTSELLSDLLGMRSTHNSWCEVGDIVQQLDWEKRKPGVITMVADKVIPMYVEFSWRNDCS